MDKFYKEQPNVLTEIEIRRLTETVTLIQHVRQFVTQLNNCAVYQIG